MKITKVATMVVNMPMVIAGMFLYPGTSDAGERGKGKAEGTKLNIPMQPGAGDRQFFAEWERVVEFLKRHRPKSYDLIAGACGLGPA